MANSTWPNEGLKERHWENRFDSESARKKTQKMVEFKLSAFFFGGVMKLKKYLARIYVETPHTKPNSV